MLIVFLRKFLRIHTDVLRNNPGWEKIVIVINKQEEMSAQPVLKGIFSGADYIFFYEQKLNITNFQIIVIVLKKSEKFHRY